MKYMYDPERNIATIICPCCGRSIERRGLPIKGENYLCLACEIQFKFTPDEPEKVEDVMVSHPPHYQSETGMETIDVIEAFTFDLKGIEAVCTGNVLKYVCRWKNKNGRQDLEKAKWYLERLINHVKKLEEENDYHDQSRNHQ